jgi:hypothetical protein
MVTGQQNHFNRNAKGYTWNKPAGKWQARLMKDGKHISLGYYDNKEEARSAYLSAKKELHIL